MEAVAIHSFDALADDELSFQKDDILKVLMMEAPWYKAELEGKEGFVPDNYLDMRPHPWYVPHITRKNVEDILLERGNDANYFQPNGAFLVRTSEDEAGNFYLSVK